ncbi:MAG TPA: lysophospholipid acyltransferase family protein [Acidobacteriaceae bacterium]|jgi:Kdo2-lipid IVA lauroyltransferase/acyltransferase|nr:lysophospholipid acyltransferase family protein [Acidobacteriaceae bacterium]
MRRRLEFALVWTLVKLLGLPPRRTARALGAMVGRLALLLTPRLRRTGDLNLRLAFPEKTAAERSQILRKLYRNLGWLLAEFCQMPRYTPEQAQRFIRYEGLENYLAARDQGKGVLILTGHLGAWELSSFYHSLMGYPMSIVIRRLDNPLVDNLVNQIRCLHGNQVLHKDDFARGLLGAMRRGETVGILMDTNMTPPQGAFVDFFGHAACTGSGLARVAMKTGAKVLPGFLLWDEATKQYVLRFGAALDLPVSDDAEADALAHTALFTRVIEDYVRQYPDQWLWVHRRWKTRPQGEAAIYT